MPLVEQEHFRSTWVHPHFLVGSCFSIFVFCAVLCRPLFVILFFWVITLLVVLRTTVTDYPFETEYFHFENIFKQCKWNDFTLHSLFKVAVFACFCCLFVCFCCLFCFLVLFFFIFFCLFFCFVSFIVCYLKPFTKSLLHNNVLYITY